MKWLTDKCDICGKPAEKYEPRFGYFSCEEHWHVPPAFRYAEKVKLQRTANDHN